MHVYCIDRRIAFTPHLGQLCRRISYAPTLGLCMQVCTHTLFTYVGGLKACEPHLVCVCRGKHVFGSEVSVCTLQVPLTFLCLKLCKHEVHSFTNGLVNQVKVFTPAYCASQLKTFQNCLHTQVKKKILLLVENIQKSHNLIGPYYIFEIGTRNSTPITRPFLAGRCMQAGHVTICPMMLFCSHVPCPQTM